MAFQDSKSMLDHGQLHVGFPKFRSRPASLIAPQQIDSVPGEGSTKLILVPGDVHPHPFPLGDGDADDRSPLGILALYPANAFQDFVAALHAVLAYLLL